MPQFPSWHREAEAGSPFPAKLMHQIPRPGSTSASDLHLAQQQVHFGVKHCFFSACWIPPLGFVLCWGQVWMGLGRLGREPALEAISSPSSCLRSRAPLRHCPTKSSAAVIAGKKKKKKSPQAVHAGSSSACNDCWVMDLHGDNFELLSAVKPCSLLCAGNEMRWLPLPGSRFSLPSLAGARQGSGAAPAAQQCWAGLDFFNDPRAEQAPRNVRWGERGSGPGISGLPDGLQRLEPEQAAGVDVALGSSLANAPVGPQPGCDIQRCKDGVTAGAVGPGVTAAG